jgi:hypothetical protein
VDSFSEGEGKWCGESVVIKKILMCKKLFFIKKDMQKCVGKPLAEKGVSRQGV